MGLLAPIILGALLIVAFALTSQQKLAIASHTGPMPARQIAYLMRVHHQSAIKQKLANPALDTIVDAAPPTMAISQDLFNSCLQGKVVATGIFTVGVAAPLLSPAEADAVVAELKLQTVGAAISPFISPPGIGLTGESLSPSVPCPMPAGVPVIITQVLP